MAIASGMSSDDPCGLSNDDMKIPGKPISVLYC